MRPRWSSARRSWPCSGRSSPRVRQDLEPQLVTVIGDPGIGKTRLVAELGS